uniref:LOW QUALITY PROTEIN: chorion peroxidase-like n=1 Tax=Drosophila rhopaloa TaxID=1041015 RepID=A0A6P4E4C0_DRORH
MRPILFVSLLLLVAQIGESQAAAFSVRQNRFDELPDPQTAAPDLPELPDLQTPAPVASSTEATEKSEKVTSGLLKKCEKCFQGIKCVPQFQCPAHVRMESHEKPQICDLPAGKFGYCCQTGQNHTGPRLEFSAKERRSRFPTILSPAVLDEARRNFEHLLHGVAQIPVRRGFPDFAHGLVFHSTAKDDFHNFAISNSAIEQVMTNGRTNQIISLITLQILLAREHNRVADALNQLNPSASDEWLFQEARRIVIAEMQHITYNEFLPIIIGPQQMKRFRLVPLHQGYAHDYNVNVNPAITNEFSGAAYRMGHSSVDGKFQIRQQHGHIDEVVNIPDVMFNPSRMRKREFYDDMLRTLYSQPMQQVDSSISQGLSRFLFRGDNPFGLDLAAINIQRGRDQGLRSYNDYLELMGAPKLQSFQQFPSEIGQKLSRVYRSPDDIDLWVGGLLEKAVEGGVVGGTFAEIIADQFARFKQGDRYYYEYDNAVNPGAFNPQQLQLRKVTMARLLCDNSDRLTLQAVPLAAFIRSDHPGNQMIDCDDASLPAVNFEAWRI